MKNLIEYINETLLSTKDLGNIVDREVLKHEGILDVKAQKNGQLKIKCKKGLMTQSTFESLLKLGNKWTITGDFNFEGERFHDVEITSNKGYIGIYTMLNKNVLMENCTIDAWWTIRTEGDVVIKNCKFTGPRIDIRTRNNKEIILPSFENCDLLDTVLQYGAHDKGPVIDDRTNFDKEFNLMNTKVGCISYDNATYYSSESIMPDYMKSRKIKKLKGGWVTEER